jgi:hypothetical protein
MLPKESLLSTESDEEWPNESPNADLLLGVKTHDFALIESALKNGADVNFHGASYGYTVLGAVADERLSWDRRNSLSDVDNETDQIISLLLAHGASPTITTSNGNTVIIPLALSGSIRAVHTLLDAGWPNDYQYRLFVGILIDDSDLIKDSLNHGADPNTKIQGGRVIASAFHAAGRLSNKGEEEKQKHALSVLELLLKAGAKIEYEDILTVDAYYGNNVNIQPVLEMLIRNTTPEIRNKCLSSLKVRTYESFPMRKLNLDWLIKA